MDCFFVDVVCHDDDCDQKQARYLVHGKDDVLWTDDVEAVLAYLRRELTTHPPAAGEVTSIRK